MVKKVYMCMCAPMSEISNTAPVLEPGPHGPPGRSLFMPGRSTPLTTITLLRVKAPVEKIARINTDFQKIQAKSH